MHQDPFLTIRLEVDLERELEAVCVETGRSRGDIVRDALRRQLQRMRFERLAHRRRRVYGCLRSSNGSMHGPGPAPAGPGDAAEPDLGAGCACAAEARRQSLLVAQSPEEADMQAFIDSVVEWPDAETSH